jgi:predicted transcriptional regulator of viral defense system
MKHSTSKFDQLKPILKKAVFSVKDAKELGVSSSNIYYYVKKGFLETVGRGIYTSAELNLNVHFKWHDLIIVAKSVPQGVICLVSALDIYDLTDEIPRKHWIAIPNNMSCPKREHATFIRMRDIKTGKITYQLDGESICIFNIERTIIDSFRLLSLEIAFKALKTSIKEDKVDLKKLRKYAKKFHVNIDPYIHSLMI